MFHWRVKTTQTIACSPATLWRLWSQVDRWLIWNHSLDWAKLNGPFAVGTVGQIKPLYWPASSFKITEISERHYFETEGDLPGIALSFRYEMKPVDATYTEVTHSAVVRGWLAPLYFLTLGIRLHFQLPPSLLHLRLLAEKEPASISKSCD